VSHIIVIYYHHHLPTTAVHQVPISTYNDEHKGRNILNFHQFQKNDSPCHKAHQEKRDTAASYGPQPDD